MKTLKLWTGKTIISDGKGKGSAHVSENENKYMPEKVGFRGLLKIWAEYRQIHFSPGLILLKQNLYLFNHSMTFP